MSSTTAKVFLFLLLVLGAFLWVGQAITAMTGGAKKASSVVEVSPEGGESIFWGKGRCYTCHSLGGQGSAVRCPNLGQFGEKFALAIGERAAQRAKERSEETGEHYTATDYLVESLAKPDAYLVEGYKNEMAIVYAPPISLSLNDIKAVVSYLQSQGGDLDLESIEQPSEVAAKYYARISAAGAAGGGDPGAGEEVFVDNCEDCHQLQGEGGEIGPSLDGISEKGLKFITESILKPAKKITKGYETYRVVDKEGRRHVGLKTRDDAAEIDITKATGDVITIVKSDIKELEQDEVSSVMPEDLTEAMTVKDFQDVQAYLMMQKSGEADQ
ncbi:MAG: c-type cytochrome [Gammaproteobacteria bacterium]|jgi:putative heme-binding domain-containing protein|nr:c-type cytochrome [Gammaproteobacteria bacterium]NCF83343.1 c-type cytochrome [Pseudomonadota bacterium]